MVLAGGGALLRDIDRLLMEETGLPVIVAMIRSPASCAVRARRWKGWTSWGASSRASKAWFPVPWTNQAAAVFSRGPAPLVRLGFFVCLAVLLMVLGTRVSDTPSPCARLSLACIPAAARCARAGICSAPPPDSSRRRCRSSRKTSSSRQSSCWRERLVDGSGTCAPKTPAKALARGTRASAA